MPAFNFSAEIYACQSPICMQVHTCVDKGECEVHANTTASLIHKSKYMQKTTSTPKKDIFIFRSIVLIEMSSTTLVIMI